VVTATRSTSRWMAAHSRSTPASSCTTTGPTRTSLWSTDAERMLSFPAQTFVRFLLNHGLTSLVDRPAWFVVEGGSMQYVKKLIAPFADRIHLDSPVQRIARDAERETLGAMKYQSNEAVLHSDASLLPRARRAWASWNYHLPKQPRGRVVVTYDMNALQGLREAPLNFCVSLNPGDRIDPSKVLYRTRYDHPLFTLESVAAQKRIDEISGPRHTYYCGAYWRYGFHEDGVLSALAVAEKFGISLEGALAPELRAEAAE